VTSGSWVHLGVDRALEPSAVYDRKRKIPLVLMMFLPVLIMLHPPSERIHFNLFLPPKTKVTTNMLTNKFCTKKAKTNTSKM